MDGVISGTKQFLAGNPLAFGRDHVEAGYPDAGALVEADVVAEFKNKVSNRFLASVRHKNGAVFGEHEFVSLMGHPGHLRRRFDCKFRLALHLLG